MNPTTPTRVAQLLREFPGDSPLSRSEQTVAIQAYARHHRMEIIETYQVGPESGRSIETILETLGLEDADVRTLLIYNI